MVVFHVLPWSVDTDTNFRPPAPGPPGGDEGPKGLVGSLGGAFSRVMAYTAPSLPTVTSGMNAPKIWLWGTSAMMSTGGPQVLPPSLDVATTLRSGILPNSP